MGTREHPPFAASKEERGSISDSWFPSPQVKLPGLRRIVWTREPNRSPGQQPSATQLLSTAPLPFLPLPSKGGSVPTAKCGAPGTPAKQGALSPPSTQSACSNSKPWVQPPNSAICDLTRFRPSLVCVCWGKGGLLTPAPPSPQDPRACEMHTISLCYLGLPRS